MIKVNNQGLNNTIKIADDVKITGKFKLNVLGNNNYLAIGKGTVLGNGLIEISNNESSIDIASGCKLNGLFRAKADYTNLVINSRTTSMGVKITLHEKGTISIGEDCMFSGNTYMDVSDIHSVLDVNTNKRINPPKNIKIGDHVWICDGVHILKGVEIGSHSILGAKALVTKDVPPNSIAVGVPAKVIKDGITWHRERLPCL